MIRVCYGHSGQYDIPSRWYVVSPKIPPQFLRQYLPMPTTAPGNAGYLSTRRNLLYCFTRPRTSTFCLTNRKTHLQAKNHSDFFFSQVLRLLHLRYASLTIFFWFQFRKQSLADVQVTVQKSGKSIIHTCGTRDQVECVLDTSTLVICFEGTPYI